MKFKPDLKRALACCLALLLVSCGGATQIEGFAPRRAIAFGDESALINSDGTKYSINALVYDTTQSPPVPISPPTRDCAASPTWVQYTASTYGFVFPECNPSNIPTASLMRAAPNAHVAQIATQVTSFVGADAFGDNDLVMISVGANDIIDLYRLVVAGTLTEAAALQAAGQAGNDLGTQVIRVTALSAKVLVTTVPNQGATPYAASVGGSDLLTRLTQEFNEALGLRLSDVPGGGHNVGLVFGYDILQTMALNPAAYNLVDISRGGCAVDFAPPALPTCTDLDLRAPDPGGTQITAGGWLWADSLRLGPVANTQWGIAGAARAHGNPF